MVLGKRQWLTHAAIRMKSSHHRGLLVNLLQKTRRPTNKAERTTRNHRTPMTVLPKSLWGIAASCSGVHMGGGGGGGTATTDEFESDEDMVLRILGNLQSYVTYMEPVDSRSWTGARETARRSSRVGKTDDDHRVRLSPDSPEQTVLHIVAEPRSVHKLQIDRDLHLSRTLRFSVCTSRSDESPPSSVPVGALPGRFTWLVFCPPGSTGSIPVDQQPQAIQAVRAPPARAWSEPHPSVDLQPGISPVAVYALNGLRASGRRRWDGVT